MKMSKMKYNSDILEMIHENATATFEIGAISEAKMQEYGEMCLAEKSEIAQEAGNSEGFEYIGLVAV